MYTKNIFYVLDHSNSKGFNEHINLYDNLEGVILIRVYELKDNNMILIATLTIDKYTKDSYENSRRMTFSILYFVLHSLYDFEILEHKYEAHFYKTFDNGNSLRVENYNRIINITKL